MPTAQLLHLLTAVPQADPPDPGTFVSATTPDGGILTSRLLDPASSTVGATQVVQSVAFLNGLTQPKNIVLGRWLTKPLPAQTIGAGNWSIYAAGRLNPQIGGSTWNLWGLAVGQWRPGTGLIARFLDAPTGGTGALPGNGNTDVAGRTTVAGSALTLVANDCVIVELWTRVTVASPGVGASAGVLLGGLGQYATGVYTGAVLTDTDATLLAPAAITFS